MKHLLTLCLLAVTMCAVAQNKKIALLEPREGEGSTEISGMEKAMVRGELRKAIVNHTGYEAFTRADVDQLMKEQDLQRTIAFSIPDISVDPSPSRGSRRAIFLFCATAHIVTASRQRVKSFFMDIN